MQRRQLLRKGLVLGAVGLLLGVGLMVWLPPASAMKPGAPQVVKCPSCEMLQKRRTLTSGNMFAATYYSDGIIDAPMLPEEPYYVRCPSCFVFFKLSKEVIIGEIPLDTWEWNEDLSERVLVRPIDPKWLEAPLVRFLSTDEYRWAIRSGLYNSGAKDSEEWKEDILSLRFAFWRASNDGRRDKLTYDDNCRVLLAALANANDAESLITRAEIYRNLGEFDKCINLLDQIKNPAEYEPYISAIRAACKANDLLTVIVRDESDDARFRRTRMQLLHRPIAEHEVTEKWTQMPESDRISLIYATSKIPLTELERILEARRSEEDVP